MPSIHQLEYVLAVDKLRNFSKAAEACYITQPTLSMQIQKLEDELGISIFDRDKKPIIPTKLGALFIKQAGAVIAEYKKLNEVVKVNSHQVSGDFRLAVIPTLSPYLIPLFLKNFSEKNPKVQLKIEELQTSQIIDKLQTDEIDGALLATPLEESNIQEDILFYEPFYLYANENHELSSKSKVHEDDLDGSDLWLLTDGHCIRNQMIKICSLKKTKNIIHNVQFESGNLETLKKLVSENSGYTLLPFLALDSKLPPHIKVLEFNNPVPSREISLVYSRSQLKKNILNALKESILESLPPSLTQFKKKKIEVIKIS